MAIKSIIFKVNIGIADIDHGYYTDHALTIAKHPSETNERMMVRLLAFCLQAHQLETLCQGDAMISFGPGLSDADEPDVYIKDFTDQFQIWIKVGQPDDRCHQPKPVINQKKSLYMLINMPQRFGLKRSKIS
jgi:uncharacterized protein YaeQ